jgi:hypothetical protein
MRAKHAKPWIGTIPSGIILLDLAFVLATCQAAPGTASLVTPTATLTPFPASSPVAIIPPATPTLDRLAEPPLPANPTQLELGRHLFWLNCMPCHGDQGQGLTDEFRRLYVEDANCWARGCHGGKVGDQGFPVPHTVPAIISSSGELPHFPSAPALFEFLRRTHPPQNPGLMPDSDYWAITAYVVDQNGRLPTGEVLGPQK